jgi:hypothetical protein
MHNDLQLNFHAFKVSLQNLFCVCFLILVPSAFPSASAFLKVIMLSILSYSFCILFYIITGHDGGITLYNRKEIATMISIQHEEGTARAGPGALSLHIEEMSIIDGALKFRWGVVYDCVCVVWCGVMGWDGMGCGVMWCGDVVCCAVLCCAVLCCAVLCCAVLCCAVLCCAVLCRNFVL